MFLFLLTFDRNLRIVESRRATLGEPGVPGVPGVIDAMWRDVRYALRGLRRSPGFHAVAVATLALGIGANMAVFSVVDAVLLRRLAVRAPEQLVLLAETDGRRNQTRESYQTYQYFREAAIFAGITASSVEQSVLIGATRSELINVEVVTGDYFQMLGIVPSVGRFIQPDDDRLPGAHAVAVLSHAFWNQQFGADPGVLGHPLSLAGGTFLIIGVAPASFVGLDIDEPADLWVPFMMTEQVRPGFRPWNALPRSNWLRLVGRLRPGTSLKDAEAAASAVYQQWQERRIHARAGAEPPGGAGRVHIVLMPALTGFSAVRTQFAQPLFVLMVAVGFVLLVSCTNVSSMLLARAGTRQKEIATRLALGSSAGRLIQQYLVEGVLLAFLGGLAGLFIAFNLGPVLLRFLPAGTDQSAFQVGPDLRVIGLTLVVTAGTAILIGLAPTFLSLTSQPSVALKGNSSSGSTVSRGFRGRNVLVILQIVLSLTILIAAGLFAQTLRNLQRVDVGFEMPQVSLLEFHPPLSGYGDDETRRFFRDLVERLPGIPGVSTVSFASLYTFNGSSERSELQGDGTASDERVEAETSYVGPEYFKALGIPIVQGREFTMEEAFGRDRHAAIVSQAVARRIFGDANAVGRRIQRPPDMYVVVGVAKDVKYNSLREDSPGVLYIPGVWGYTTLMVRTQASAAGMASTIRREVDKIDKRVPVRRVSTLDQQVKRSMRTERLLAVLSLAFGALVSLLAAVGVYGLVSQSVHSRTGEFGIRMALGANRADVLWLVLRGTLSLVGMAVLIGVPLALVATRFVSGLLYGLSPADPATIGGAVVLLLATALVASWTPAARAARLDASSALRHQ